MLESTGGLFESLGANEKRQRHWKLQRGGLRVQDMNCEEIFLEDAVGSDLEAIRSTRGVNAAA